MSIWLLRGRESFRWDGHKLFGRPPSLSPPSWALAERVWEGIGAHPGSEGLSILPTDAIDRLCEAVPAGSKQIALVVPDGTRVGPWRQILPQVLSGLRGKSAGKSLLVASGVHQTMPVEALFRHLLPEASSPEDELEGWSVIQNGDNAFDSHVLVGETPAGTPVRLHPAYLEADWRILLGEISYHYFAGFGGGRKLVFPGMAEPQGISRNHRRAVAVPPETWADPGREGLEGFAWEAGCGPGLLEGNPVHEDLDAAARLAPPHWVVTAVEHPPADPDPSAPEPFPVHLVQGPYPAALDRAGDAYEAARRLRVTHRPACLVVDAGGEPRDATFLQAHKSLQHAVRFAGPETAILLVAGCADGVGSPYLKKYAEETNRFRPLADVLTNPSVAVHLQTLVAMRSALEDRQVALWSELSEGIVRGLGMIPIRSQEEALDFCRVRKGLSWGWLPRAERFLPEQVRG